MEKSSSNTPKVSIDIHKVESDSSDCKAKTIAMTPPKAIIEVNKI